LLLIKLLLNKESIETLYNWAKLYFSKIKNKKIKLDKFNEPPLTKEYLMVFL